MRLSTRFYVRRSERSLSVSVFRRMGPWFFKTIPPEMCCRLRVEECALRRHAVSRFLLEDPGAARARAPGVGSACVKRELGADVGISRSVRDFQSRRRTSVRDVHAAVISMAGQAGGDRRVAGGLARPRRMPEATVPWPPGIPGVPAHPTRRGVLITDRGAPGASVASRGLSRGPIRHWPTMTRL